MTISVNKLEALELIQKSRAHDGKGSSFLSVTAQKKDKTLFKVNGLVVDSPKSHRAHPNLITIKTSSGGFKVIDVNKTLQVKTRGSVVGLS